MSDAPVTTSAMSERRNDVESPNTTVASPKIATHQNIVTPARRFSGKCATATASPRPQSPARFGGDRAPRSDMQDVARVDGEERGGAAEEDREEIE